MHVGDDPTEAGRQTETSIPVLVVDDQEPFRRAMRELVDSTDGCHLAGEAASGEEAIAAVAGLSPRVVIIDKRMPGIGGVEAARQLTGHDPNLFVVLISGEDPDPNVAAACGAALFVRKTDLSVELLRDVVRRVRGERA
jgi:DNA-binding NarL/FixJ family response regulator